MIPAPSLSTSNAASSSVGRAEQTSRSAAGDSGGAGVRGFVNNFAAAGAKVDGQQVNGAAWTPSSWMPYVIGLVGLVGVFVLVKAYGTR